MQCWHWEELLSLSLSLSLYLYLSLYPVLGPQPLGTQPMAFPDSSSVLEKFQSSMCDSK